MRKGELHLQRAIELLQGGRQGGRNAMQFGVTTRTGGETSADQVPHHTRLNVYATNERSKKTNNKILLLAMHYTINRNKSSEAQHSDVVRIQYMIDKLGLQAFSWAEDRAGNIVGYSEDNFASTIDLSGFQGNVPDVVALDYRWMQDRGYFIPGRYGNNWFTNGEDNGKIGQCIDQGVKIVLIANNAGGNVGEMYDYWSQRVQDKRFHVQPLSAAQSETLHPLVVATMYSEPKEAWMQHYYVFARELACYERKSKEPQFIDGHPILIPDVPAFYCCYAMDLRWEDVQGILANMCNPAMNDIGSIAIDPRDEKRLREANAELKAFLDDHLLRERSQDYTHEDYDTKIAKKKAMNEEISRIADEIHAKQVAAEGRAAQSTSTSSTAAPSTSTSARLEDPDLVMFEPRELARAHRAKHGNEDRRVYDLTKGPRTLAEMRANKKKEAEGAYEELEFGEIAKDRSIKWI